jgi:Secretion system C-terminal sorting domain
MKFQNIIFFACLSIFSLNAYSQLPLVSKQSINFSTAVRSIASGNWSDPAIWNSGKVPSATTDVIINDNHTVYIDIQGSASGVIVDLCRNLQVRPTAVLRMGHNVANFAKDLRINGSLLCNGTFSSGRNLPEGTGTGLIYTQNSRIFLNLTQDTTYISGAGYFNPRSLNISSEVANKSLIIDQYNTHVDENFAIKSNNRVHVTISHFAYVKIKGILGLTGSDYQFSTSTAKSDLIIDGIVVADDVSLFTRNATAGQTTSLTITNRGSLYTQKINKGVKDRKSEAAGFKLTIEVGGLFRLGRGVDFNNLTANNPNFTFINNGELRKYYTETIKSKSEITASIDKFDPNIVGKISKAKDVFGASHIGGWYNFTDINTSSSKPFMEEGLDFYKTFGATSIKTALTTLNGRMYDVYPFNHTWPNFNTLKEVAQNEYIISLFSRDHIITHTFWTTTKKQGDFRKGPDFNHATFLNEEQQFYELTKYLLQTYGSKNKKFVYQNWEGDWMLRGEGVEWDRDPTLIPDDVAWTTEGMARLFRARQRGTERARSEFPNAKAKVFYAIEFNKLWYQKNGSFITMMDNGTPSVLGDVIPNTRIDLASWSAYDGAWTDNDHPVGHAMWKGLEIARYYTTQTGDMEFNCPVQIGEFAINENPRYNSTVTEFGIRSKYGRYIGIAFGLGIPNFYLWNFYGSGAQDGPVGFTWEKSVKYDVSFLNQWLDGKWLLKPDSTWGFAAEFLMEQWVGTISSNPDIELSNISFHPNPTTGYVSVTGLENDAVISIFDVHGRELKKINYSIDQDINVSDLIQGTYFMIVQNANNKPIKVHKLIKY